MKDNRRRDFNNQWMLQRVAAIRNLISQGALEDGTNLLIAQAFGFSDWNDFRENMTADHLPQLEVLAGPNGFTILKAMLAKRGF